MQILKKPIITEKVSALNESGVYGFVVDIKANKIQIKEAVEGKYGVTVEQVRTMNYLGKSKVRYTKAGFISGKSSDVKKAIVKLAEGEIIDIYDNV
ncbi:50S ribosomal protein L23 [Chondrinema litorale]|uniref:50S ribosomal protein L23 n=1 Tax=Chondrinema litorale TaxID=2994555 RepID=UPI0025449BAC|nr:50S ribosomal protein L23 [Chondrinema litorale]UZR92771.1 50S ribosomal protein L23 [Chondrinema litorale]